MFKINARYYDYCVRKAVFANSLSERTPTDFRFNLKPDSYLFSTKTFPNYIPFDKENISKIDIGDNWFYVNRIMPPYHVLDLYFGNITEFCAFDDYIFIPSLFRKDTIDPIMSVTPSELITLQPGIDLAGKHTVVAGMGMGWQAIMVARKQNVKKVTIVEKEDVIIKTFSGVIQERLSRPEWKKIEIIRGDAYEVVPKIKCDAALIDIYDGYGDNLFPKCKAKKVWVWGGWKKNKCYTA